MEEIVIDWTDRGDMVNISFEYDRDPVITFNIKEIWYKGVNIIDLFDNDLIADNFCHHFGDSLEVFKQKHQLYIRGQRI